MSQLSEPKFNESLEQVARVAARYAAEVDARGRFPEETLAALRDERLLGLLSASDVGGSGGGLRQAARAVERVARECASSAMVLCMHYSGAAVLERHGDEATRRAVAAGQHLSTLAFSELGSRSHFWAPVSTATESAGGVHLDAHKSWVTSAHHATAYLWSSKPLAAQGASTLWLVPRGASGLDSAAPFNGLGLRGNESSAVIARQVPVSRAAMLGPDGGGFEVMMGIVLPTFSVLNAACSVGLMESAVTQAAAHVVGTKLAHLGSSIADLPTVRAYLARARLRTDAARSLWEDTVSAVEAGRPDAQLRVLEVKALCGESALEVTELAMRVCGGAAFRKESSVERAFRDARASAVMAPTSDVLFDFIGKAMVGMPLF